MRVKIFLYSIYGKQIENRGILHNRAEFMFNFLMDYKRNKKTYSKTFEGRQLTEMNFNFYGDNTSLLAGLVSLFSHYNLN